MLEQQEYGIFVACRRRFAERCAYSVDTDGIRRRPLSKERLNFCHISVASSTRQWFIEKILLPDNP